jgi:plasmid maintenance system antidote protein VapI
MKHRGKILELAIIKSGYTKTAIAKRMGVDRSTIYNWIENPNLDADTIMDVGKIIGYDYSYDLGIKKIEDINEDAEKAMSLSQCMSEKDILMRKLIDAMEKNEALYRRIIELQGS